MATKLVQQYPFFTNKNGAPLNNGKIYIGEENKNPITNPIQVYWDEDLTQPAAQPLQTLYGYIIRAGTPSNIYFSEGKYSILSNDNKDSQIFYEAVVDGINLVEELFVSVKSFSAVGDGVTDDTEAFLAALASGADEIYVPKGRYCCSAIDLYGSNWIFDIGAVLVNLDGSSPWSGRMKGIPSGSEIWDPQSSRPLDMVMNHRVLTYVNNEPYSNTDGDDNVKISFWNDRTASSSPLKMGMTGPYIKQNYGFWRASTSGSTSNLLLETNVYNASNKNTEGVSVDRTEIKPLSQGVNVAQNAECLGISLFNDLSVSGPSSDDPYYREIFMSGLSAFVQKRAPGNYIDSVYRGSSGISIHTNPWAGGFAFESPNRRNWPIRAGVDITGISGDPNGGIIDANSAGVDFGFDIGVKIGGIGGSPWQPAALATGRSTKVAVGVDIQDYTLNAIRIRNPHPDRTSTSPAIDIQAGSGGIRVGTTSEILTRLLVGGMTDQYTVPVYLEESYHATSKRTGISIGDWLIHQDTLGDGTRNFGIYAGTARKLVMWIDQNGVIHFPDASSIVFEDVKDSLTGLVSGNIWRNSFGELRMKP